MNRAKTVASTTLTWVFTAVAIALLAVMVIIPRLNGGHALTVLTGSMEPTHSPGDLVVTRGVDNPSQISTGDVLTFMPYANNPTLVTHRVISVNEDGTFTTRGDANGTDDAPIVFKQVVGEVMFGVPKLGYASDFVRSNLQLLIFPIGGALLVYGAYCLIRQARPKRTDTLTPQETTA